MHWLGLSVALLALVSAGLAADYCSSSLCPAGTTHIACNNDGKFAATCSSNVRLVNLTSQIATMVGLHNKYRNDVAGGGVEGLKPAKRMATMQWDKELASVAEFNVKQCQMRHDQCRNTATFKHSGQNLAYLSYTGRLSMMSDDAILKTLVQSWFDESKNTKMAQINSYPASQSGPAIGHFTVMAADRNIRVGCAAARYTTIKEGHNFLLACNYATTNIVGEPIYAAGPAGSGCTKGKNAVLKNLCAVAETYSGL